MRRLVLAALCVLFGLAPIAGWSSPVASPTDLTDPPIMDW